MMRELGFVFASFLLAGLFFSASGYAVPMISNLNVQPQNPWLGIDDAELSLDCVDDANNSITSVYSTISGADISPFNITGDLVSGSTYSMIVHQYYLTKNVSFNAAVYCQNNASETSAPSTLSFKVLNISSEIKSISSSPSYIGDDIQADFILRKDGNPITSDVIFDIKIDNVPASLLFPPIAIGGAWGLKFSSSSLAAGNHTVAIFPNYLGRSAPSRSVKFELREPIEFSILGIDRTEVQAGNEIVATMKAMDRNVPIQIVNSYLSIQVDSTSASIAGISEVASGTYNVRITMPSVSSGTRQLKITFNYVNFLKTENRTITYVIPVSGKIAGSDGKGMGIKLAFNEKVVSTNAADGTYSAYLSPGTYKITLAHDASTLELNGAQISSFDDPIKYYYLPTLDVPGIKEAGVFVYEVALDYSDAYLRMKYDEGKVSDESALNVYECANWNSGRKECVSGWHEISSSIDIVRNVASANVSEAHAYAIGTDETVDADAALERAAYILNEKIKLSGIVRDSGGNTVSGANITARIEGTDKVARAVSGVGGAYSLEMQPPSAEGKYTLVVSIEKRPYISSTKKLEFSVAKSRDLSIVAPDVVRVNQGTSTIAEFRILNTGQADISNLKVSIGGVPSNYYSISPLEISLLKSGEEKKISVSFSIPADAAKTTLGAVFEISGGFSASRNFGLSITATEAQSVALSNSTSIPGNSLSFSLPTALASLYPSDGAAAYLLLFAVVSLSSAVILRKARLSGTGSIFRANKAPARSLLFDIKKKVVEPKGAAGKTAKKASGRRKKGKFSKYAGRW